MECKGNTQTGTRKEGIRTVNLVIPVVPSICEKGLRMGQRLKTRGVRKSL